MKIIESNRAPNPRRVRIFLAEKGIDVAFEQIDLGKLDHRRPEFCEFNPMKQVPVLILDDGTAIAETVAICRYFEGIKPEPRLFGEGALEGSQNRDVEPAARIRAVLPCRTDFPTSASGDAGYGSAASVGLGGGQPVTRL